jgi:hypothetical protein
VRHPETAVTHADGSITLTKVDRNADGTLKQTLVDTVNALGSLTLRITTDRQGRKTAQTVVNADGNSVSGIRPTHKRRLSIDTKTTSSHPEPSN